MSILRNIFIVTIAVLALTKGTSALTQAELEAEEQRLRDMLSENMAQQLQGDDGKPRILTAGGDVLVTAKNVQFITEAANMVSHPCT